MVRVTSARPSGAREVVPAKTTSSILPPRRDLAPCSPITQDKASTMLDLPEPFGPTTHVIPGSRRRVVAEANDLNPRSVRLLRYTRRPPPRGLMGLRAPYRFAARETGNRETGAGAPLSRGDNNEEGRPGGRPSSLYLFLVFLGQPALRRARVRGPAPACPREPPQPSARCSLPGAGQARLPGPVHAVAGGASRIPCGDRDRRRGQIEPSPSLKVLHAE